MFINFERGLGPVRVSELQLKLDLAVTVGTGSQADHRGQEVPRRVRIPRGKSA